MPSASTVAELAVVITADTKQAEQGLSDLGTKVGNAGSALQSAFAGAAVAGIAAVGAGLAASVVAATDFEKTMSGVKAVSGATAEEMAALQQTALDLGAKTAFSASEAGKGLEELVTGGLSVEEAMAAAESTLNLAAAGGVSVADAATIAANALAQFGLHGTDMAHVSDLIAGAANASALDVGQFKYSLQAAGAVASTVGFSFDDLSQAIAVMGKAGITGSDAGTSLKTMMLNLQPSTNKQKDLFRELGLETNNLQAGLDGIRKKGIEPLTEDWPGLNRAMIESLGFSQDVSKWTNKQHDEFDQLSQQLGATGSAFFDASGKVKSMAEVAQILQTSLEGQTEAQKLANLETIFGSDAIRAGAVLAKEGAAGFNDMAAAMGKVTAESVGAEKLNNVAGSVEQLKGSLETMGITIGLELLPILKDFVDALTAAANDAMPSMQQAAKDVASTLKEWMPTLKALATFLWDNRDAILAVGLALATFAILTTVIGWVTAIAGAIGAVTAAISASGGILAALGALVAILGGPVTLVVAAVAAAVALLAYAWANNWGDIRGKTAAVVDFLSGVPDMISGFFDAIATTFDDLVTAVSDAWTTVKTTTETVWDGIKTFLSDWWRVILVALTGPIGALAVFVIDHWNDIKTATETIFGAIKNLLTAIWDLIFTEVIKPKVDAIKLYLSETWEAIRLAIDEKTGAMSALIGLAWDAVSSKTTEVLGVVLAYVRDTIFEPMRAAIETAINAARDLIGLAWDAVSSKAHEVLDPVLAYIRDSIFGPIKAAAETAMSAVSSAFATSVNAVKTTVDTVMEGVKNAWTTMWGAIQTAAESPAKALETVTTAIQKLKDVMPEWLIPHSPTPFEMGIRGIADAVAKMQDRMTSFSSGAGAMSGEVEDWLKAAIEYTKAPANWLEPLKWIVAHESGGDPTAKNPNSTASGLFQIIDTTWAGSRDKSLPNDIWNPIINAIGGIRYIKGRYGDPFEAVDFWKANQHYAAGGWAGLHGPELAWLGERGPEYVVPNSALRGGGGSDAGMQSVSMPIVIGDRVIEELWITGRDLAIRRGRVPGAGAASMGSLA